MSHELSVHDASRTVISKSYNVAQYSAHGIVIQVFS